MAPEHRFSWHSVLPHPVSEVFDWHARPGAFERLNDPRRPVVVTQSSGSIQEGAEVSIRVPVVGPIGLPWHFRHTRYVQNREFVDEQIRGPFRSWRHEHRFIPEGETSTGMHDELAYSLPRGCSPLEPFLKRELRRLFSHRHALLRSDLDLHARWRHKPRKKIVIAGSSGFVGTALQAFLTTGGHEVVRLVRRTPSSSSERMWDPARGVLDKEVFQGADAVIALSGENIASGRWTRARKNLIERSRVETTKLVASVLATLPKPPAVAILASGVGYYGDTGDSVADESSPLGDGFLPKVCQAWELAAQPIEHAGIRLAHLRLGTVLNARGGALRKMLPAFTIGLGGALGNGLQWMSWIAMQDLLGIVEHVLFTDSLKGPINCVAPQPCRNREFAQTLGGVIHRPTAVTAPALVLKALFGEMAEALLLANSRVVPSALTDSGYKFVFPELTQALLFESAELV